jgi:hypothetical protein
VPAEQQRAKEQQRRRRLEQQQQAAASERQQQQPPELLAATPSTSGSASPNVSINGGAARRQARGRSLGADENRRRLVANGVYDDWMDGFTPEKRRLDKTPVDDGGGGDDAGSAAVDARGGRRRRPGSMGPLVARKAVHDATNSVCTSRARVCVCVWVGVRVCDSRSRRATRCEPGVVSISPHALPLSLSLAPSLPRSHPARSCDGAWCRAPRLVLQPTTRRVAFP